jgi:hypothetical protein
MAKPIRLFHSGLGQYFIVDADIVCADVDGDGLIAKGERYAGAAESALIAAARHFADYYDAPFPGARSLDPQITSGGRLNNKEIGTFSQDSKGVRAKRPDLMGHLDFFDRATADGMITPRENYQSWRALGFGVWKALSLTLGSAVVFGRLADGFGIDVERISEKRPRGSTRIYGPDGNVDQARLAEFTAVFGTEGILTHDQLKAALAERVELGTIPRRQFESLFVLTERINGSKTVTKAQFVGLFDNSLFWAVASIPQRSGGRTL